MWQSCSSCAIYLRKPKNPNFYLFPLVVGCGGGSSPTGKCRMHTLENRQRGVAEIQRAMAATIDKQVKSSVPQNCGGMLRTDGRVTGTVALTWWWGNRTETSVLIRPKDRDVNGTRHSTRNCLVDRIPVMLPHFRAQSQRLDSVVSSSLQSIQVFLLFRRCREGGVVNLTLTPHILFAVSVIGTAITITYPGDCLWIRV